MKLIYLLSIQERWRRLCERNREFQQALTVWIRKQRGSSEEKEAYSRVERVRKKLHRLGASLGMSAVGTELPLPRRYRGGGTPPVPRWILAR